MSTNLAKLGVAKIRETIIACHGNLRHMAAKLNCDRSNLSYFIKSKPRLAKLLEEQREVFCDAAETTLWNALHSDMDMVRLIAAKYVLDTIGRARGYGQDGPTVNILNLQNETIAKLPNERLAEIAKHFLEAHKTQQGPMLDAEVIENKKSGTQSQDAEV